MDTLWCIFKLDMHVQGCTKPIARRPGQVLLTLGQSAFFNIPARGSQLFKKKKHLYFVHRSSTLSKIANNKTLHNNNHDYKPLTKHEKVT